MIIEQLNANHALLLQVARAAHEAAIHINNVPDSKHEKPLPLKLFILPREKRNFVGDIVPQLSEF